MRRRIMTLTMPVDCSGGGSLVTPIDTACPLTGGPGATPTVMTELPLSDDFLHTAAACDDLLHTVA